MSLMLKNNLFYYNNKMTTTVNVLKSALPELASTTTIQNQIKQAIEETIANFYHYETINLSSSIKDNTATRDTAGYQRYSVIVESTLPGTEFQIEWSNDDFTWYFVDYASTTNSTSDVTGGNSVDTSYVEGLVRARYLRVSVYNSMNSPTLDIRTTLLH